MAFAIVERFKQESMYGWPPGQNKVAVMER